MASVNLNDIEIAYNIHGAGEPVILIGGFTMVKEAWELQISDLANHFRVITFDNRGVGESSVPSGDYTISDMAADTAGLMDALEIESANFFGVSMGSLIIQILALDHQDRVKKAALGCATHGGRHAIQADKDALTQIALAADPAVPPEKSIRELCSVLYSESFIREETERLEKIIQMRMKYIPTAEGIEGQLKALSIFNVRKRLHEIQCPVLAITGSDDRVIPPENSTLLSNGIRGAKIHIVEGAGHGFIHERPEEVNRALIDFFKN